ncbi:MAG TPA: hypothetical protein VHE30_11800 [Polyangiaceae bacterium]|nr:hypothetical protein [Polyangiaceae bacterium]
MIRLSRLLPFVAAALAGGCGTVDAGPDFQFAEVVYDQNYFYCTVQPMLAAQSCGPGAAGDSGGCHEQVTRFRVLPLAAPIPCSGNVPTGLIPAEAQSNYESASAEMTPDPDRAPLFNRPTRRAAHPRQIFAPDSKEAKIIRDWATKYTSQ